MTTIYNAGVLILHFETAGIQSWGTPAMVKKYNETLTSNEGQSWEEAAREDSKGLATGSIVMETGDSNQLGDQTPHFEL